MLGDVTEVAFSLFLQPGVGGGHSWELWELGRVSYAIAVDVVGKQCEGMGWRARWLKVECLLLKVGCLQSRVRTSALW